MGITELTGIELIMAGGPVMYPIILCSFFAVTIIVEKLVLFWKINTNTFKLKNDVFELIRNNKMQEAIEHCEKSNSPVAKILKGGIVKFGSARDDIKEAMEDISLFEIPKLEKKLTALATIAHIAPLLGLLGTVTGLTNSFHTIQIKASSLNPVTPGDLAGGIWQALLTTVAGLVVAIPTFVAYNYCVSRINSFILEMERAATELVNFLCSFSNTSVNKS